MILGWLVVGNGHKILLILKDVNHPLAGALKFGLAAFSQLRSSPNPKLYFHPGAHLYMCDGD